MQALYQPGQQQQQPDPKQNPYGQQQQFVQYGQPVQQQYVQYAQPQTSAVYGQPAVYQPAVTYTQGQQQSVGYQQQLSAHKSYLYGGLGLALFAFIFGIASAPSDSWVIQPLGSGSEFDVGFFNAKICSRGSCDSGDALCKPKGINIDYCGPYNQGRAVLGIGLFMAICALVSYGLIFKYRQSRTTSYIYITIVSSLVASICFFIAMPSAAGIKSAFDGYTKGSGETASFGYPYYLVAVAGVLNLLSAGLAAYLIKLSAAVAL
ncbi:hypothetical protein HDU76_009254 [Blyttiomyces sp. JEL0837]|nr:hypothetical protein HDU76_009254 [Blyttiomyces sp. JEL0837]